MEPYKNLSGTSGVNAFELHDTSIHVRFRNGATYQYTDKLPGSLEVLRMKTLARRGLGLNTFINRHVRKNYAARLD